jgi:hypothetical protein
MCLTFAYKLGSEVLASDVTLSKTIMIRVG